jgi:hypothetical protein
MGWTCVGPITASHSVGFGVLLKLHVPVAGVTQLSISLGDQGTGFTNTTLTGQSTVLQYPT